MSAQGRRQAIAAAQEIDGAGLTVILGKDAAIPALPRTQTVPGLRGFRHDLFPSELVGVPLRQG